MNKHCKAMVFLSREAVFDKEAAESLYCSEGREESGRTRYKIVAVGGKQKRLLSSRDRRGHGQ